MICVNPSEDSFLFCFVCFDFETGSLYEVVAVLEFTM